MEFLRFLERESKALDRRLLVLAGLAGIINVFIIYSLTLAAGKAVQGKTAFFQLAWVILALVGYWVSEGVVMRRMTIVVEEIVERIRGRIVDKIRRSDLASIEQVGRAAPYNVISTHAMNISRGATAIISAFTAAVLITWAFLIILYLSAPAFLVLIGALAFVIVSLQLNQRKIARALHAAVGQDNQFVHGFGDLLDGFKEIKLSTPKAEEFLETELKPLAGEARKMRTEAGLSLNRSVLLGTSSLFLVLTALVFVLPVVAPQEAPKLVRLTTFVVFIFGPLGQVVGVYPLFNEAVASIREIQRVEQLLDSIHENGLAESSELPEPLPVFETLRCDQLAFTYRDERGESAFSLEPLNFQLSKGELVFITGGNGSGKSTFLKILAGLYAPASGMISLNDLPVGPRQREPYRNLFAAVFSDFHLFNKVYGVTEIDEPRLQDLLQMAELAHKMTIQNRQISTVNLSSGQRKRLALVLSLLENRPILLLDEWAAEQDPPFRRKFYREILPRFKAEGKTIVAVTHDDDHYDVADRVLKMQFGKFVNS